MTALRRNGKVIFYTIQTNYDKKGTWGWYFFEDMQRIKPEDHGYPKRDVMGSVSVGFNASGECWQNTGQHGTYDLRFARIVLGKMREKLTDHEFRLVKVTIEQKVELVPDENLDTGFVQYDEVT